MVTWIKKLALILGIFTFFGAFFISLDYHDPYNFNVFIVAFLKGIVGAALFWTSGYVIGDILIKGLITDIPTEKADLADGGLLQRIYEMHDNESPIKDDMDQNSSTGDKKMVEGIQIRHQL